MNQSLNLLSRRITQLYRDGGDSLVLEAFLYATIDPIDLLSSTSSDHPEEIPLAALNQISHSLTTSQCLDLLLIVETALNETSMQPQHYSLDI